MTEPPTIDNMSPAGTPKAGYGKALQTRRQHELRKSRSDVEKETDGLIYEQFLYRLEGEKLKGSPHLSFQQTVELARALEWSVDKLNEVLGVDARLPHQIIEEHGAAINILKIPFVGAGAGMPVWNDDQQTEAVTLPALRGRRAENLFGVYLDGDSMKGYASDGKAVIFDREKEVRRGSVVAVHIPDDGLIVKEFYGVSEEGRLILGHANPSYEPRVFEAPDGATIFGVSVGRWIPDDG